MKAQLEALVELVNHQRSYGGCIDIAFAQMVIHTSGSSNHHGGTDTLERAVLLHCRASTIATDGLESGIHRFEHLLGLQSQFARRDKHYGLHSLHIGLQATKHRQQVSQCLATARRRKQHKVFPLTPSIDGGLLHRVELLDIHGRKGTLYVFRIFFHLKCRLMFVFYKTLVRGKPTLTLR